MTDTMYTNSPVIPMTNNTVSEKHDLFVTNAERRANNVLRALDVFQKCFDTQTYDYTPEEADKVLGALEAKVLEIRSSAERGSSHTHFSFN